jgi:hypothetical protein
MVRKEDAIHVPCLPLIPIRTPEDLHGTWHWVRLTSIRLDTNPARGLDTQQVIDYLKTLLPLREIHTANVHEGFELALRVIPEESQNGDHGGGRDVDSQLVFEYRELLNEFGKALGEVGAIGV